MKFLSFLFGAVLAGAAASPGAQLNMLPGMPPVADIHNLYSADAAGHFSSAVAHFPSLVYVPNSKGDSVDIIDPKPFKIVNHLDLPKKRDRRRSEERPCRE